MLVSEAIRRARAILQDEVAPYRYSDTDLVGACVQCLAEVVKARPDLFIGRGDYTSPGFFDLSLTSTLPLAEPWTQTFPQGVAALAELRDDETASSDRAAGLLSVFTSGLK